MTRLQYYLFGGLMIGAFFILMNIDTVSASCQSDADCRQGTCQDNTTDCVCINGYTGETCNTPPCTSDGEECGLHGTCDTSGDPIVCTCSDGYTGVLCSTTPCTSGGNECGTHGTCNTSGATVKCDCTDGYSGSFCTTKKNSSAAVALSLTLIVSSFMGFMAM